MNHAFYFLAIGCIIYIARILRARCIIRYIYIQYDIIRISLSTYASYLAMHK